jgi:hypothetical protein
MFIPSVALLAQAATGSGETRVALVIGNSDYPNVPLKNPVNDARDMAAALQNLGFTVTLVVDGDYPAMNRAVRDFGNAIKSKDAVALFYYSGHGVQYQGANYLIPARADILSADELPYSAVNAEQVYAKMESSGARTNLIILDACRNNPFPGSERALERGLAVVGNIQPPRSLIVYSTAPGKTAQDGEGRNGVFTKALLKHLSDPGLDAELMVRRVREDVIASTNGAQVPWHNSSITGQGFYFAGRGEIEVTSDPSGAEISVDGVRRGLSPIVLDDVARFAEVEIKAQIGNRSASRKITLRDTPKMSLELKLESERGSLVLTTSEKYSSLMLDGAVVTVTPAGALEGLEAGTHLLELRGASSVYKGQVTVVGGKRTEIAVTLIPLGSLALNLPANTACTIEGTGIKDTTARKDYGQLPVGDYRLTVTGTDYETYTETVSVKRAEVCQFAPRLRLTAAYLTGKYRTELEGLALAEKRSHIEDVDIDQVSAFGQRVQEEQRSELQGLLDDAQNLKGRLVSLKAKQAATPAQTQVTGTAMPKKGPAELYTAYSAELDGYEELEKTASLAVADLEKVSAFKLKALAQPYEDFQELGARAGTLHERLVAAKARLDQKTRLDGLVAEREVKRAAYKKTADDASFRITLGNWGFGISAASLLTSALGLAAGFIIAATPAYTGATTIVDATTYGNWITACDWVVFSGLGLGAGAALLGCIRFTATDPAPLADAVKHLDQQISELGGAQ